MSWTATRGFLRCGLALALALLALEAPAASADTSFGADPTEAVTPITCSFGAPYPGLSGFEPALGTAGSPSCLWTWNSLAGSDIVPFPVTGGSGTITSVTLPAMPNPGPMAVVVLTASLNETTNPATPNSLCCQVKQIGPTFTVPANQVATVPQSLRVSATEAANPNQPGDTSSGDLLGVAVLSPTASLPLRYTGNLSVSNFDGAYAYYPAPAAPSGEYAIPYDPAGFRLLARFTLAPDAAAGGEGAGGAGGGEPAAQPTPEPAAGGIRLANGVARVGGNGKTLALGKATNPPTTLTRQRLTALTGGRARASASAAKKPVVYGSGKTAVPAGRSRALRLNLNRRARRLLSREKKLRAKLTIVATNAAGERQTVTRTITVKPHKKKRKKK